MKVILLGYPGSQFLWKASEYLTDKYLPAFQVIYLNYTGPVSDWSDFVASYLRGLDDKHIVFALDDYLLAGPINQERFDLLLSKMDEDFVCARLCDSSFYT